jgi:hypothetical protein
MLRPNGDLIPPSAESFQASEGAALTEACKARLWKPCIALVSDVSWEDSTVYVTGNLPVGQLAEVVRDLLAHGKVQGAGRRQIRKLRSRAHGTQPLFVVEPVTPEDRDDALTQAADGGEE